MAANAPPTSEGNIAVCEDREIGFIEFGDPQGRAIFWLHGTPGFGRRIHPEARIFVERENIRLIGISRPGVGSSTPHQYESVFAFAHDMRTIADVRGIDKMAVVGISGGGPYTLACAAAMPDRVVSAGVLGGVAPASGPEAIDGGLMALGKVVAPLLQVAGAPMGSVASLLIRFIRPVASRVADLYGLVSSPADRRPPARPNSMATFLDDLLNSSRKEELVSPFADIVVFARDWGFHLDEVTVPVRWWHGEHDRIVPFAHGQHVVARLPDAELYHLPRGNHLAGIVLLEEILCTVLEVWDRNDHRAIG